MDAGVKWDELDLSALTQEDRDEIALKVKIVGKIIEARKHEGLTQAQLGKSIGIDQAVLARIEGNRTDPRLTTLLKILRPLGLTLDVVPLDGIVSAQASNASVPG